jgi:hypothetical protein
MSGHGDKLSRKQETAIAALLTEPTVETAAAKAGVSYRALKSWLTLPRFRQAYAAARQEVLERTMSQLLAASGRAVEALEANLDAYKAADKTRAAVAILTHAVKGMEMLDLAERIAELERRLDEAGKRQ